MSTTFSDPLTSFQCQNLAAGVSDVVRRESVQYTSQLDSQRSLQFGQDLRVWNRLAGFIVL